MHFFAYGRTRLIRSVTVVGTAVALMLSTVGVARSAAAAPVRIMIVGDSITQGSSRSH